MINDCMLFREVRRRTSIYWSYRSMSAWNYRPEIIVFENLSWEKWKFGSSIYEPCLTLWREFWVPRKDAKMTFLSKTSTRNTERSLLIRQTQWRKRRYDKCAFMKFNRVFGKKGQLNNNIKYSSLASDLLAVAVKWRFQRTSKQRKQASKGNVVVSSRLLFVTVSISGNTHMFQDVILAARPEWLPDLLNLTMEFETSLNPYTLADVPI